MINIEFRDRFVSKKMIDLETAANKIAELKAKSKKIGLCHGGFDLLHPGHIKHFESARKLCDVLFVSITSDEFVSSLKGSGRPIFPDNLRAYSTACVEFVDFVVITHFKTGIEAITILKPSYYIKGPDYVGKTTDNTLTAEIEAVKSVGGKIKYTTDTKLSTTEIIEYIKNKIG